MTNNFEWSFDEIILAGQFSFLLTSLRTSSPISNNRHSFCARPCWCDSAQAQGLQRKQTCHRPSDLFICSIPEISVLFFLIIERSVLIVLVFYYKGKLEMVTMQRTQEFSAFLISECWEQIAPSLCAIFNQSFCSSSLPTEWKSADIIPIHKKDSKEPAEHYRPISLLSITSKVLESCVLPDFTII